MLRFRITKRNNSVASKPIVKFEKVKLLIIIPGNQLFSNIHLRNK